MRNSTASFTLAFVLAVAATTVAQEGGSDTSGLGNHPFALGMGTGDSSAPETKVYDLRIPVGYTLIPLEDGRAWGLRLRMEVFAGVYDFFADDGSDFDLRFESIAAAPGVEFLVPVGGGWVLKPFGEIGYARDFDNSVNLGVWSVGMRSLVTWPIKKIDLSFGTKVQYLNTFTTDLKLASEFGEIRLGLDARHPLWFTVAGNQADISLYFIHRHYFGATVDRPSDDPLEIKYTDEIGFTRTTPLDSKLPKTSDLRTPSLRVLVCKMSARKKPGRSRAAHLYATPAIQAVHDMSATSAVL